jgi:predicted transcriptional regulator
MATQKVTVELPQAIFQQLARIASATQQPLEVLAAQSIASNLPPTPDNAPVEIQAELLHMQTWDDQELLAFAQSKITTEQQQRHVELLVLHGVNNHTIL